MRPVGDLERRLRADGLRPSRWANGPGDRYGEHTHGTDKVLVVVTGSIAFDLADDSHVSDLAEASDPSSLADLADRPQRSRSVELGTGDRLELPAGTRHGARVGAEGVSCLEAHLPGGTLAGRLRHLPGWADDSPAETADRGAA